MVLTLYLCVVILYIFKFGRLAFEKLLGEKFAEVIHLLAVENKFAQNQ